MFYNFDVFIQRLVFKANFLKTHHFSVGYSRKIYRQCECYFEEPHRKWPYYFGCLNSCSWLKQWPEPAGQSAAAVSGGDPSISSELLRLYARNSLHGSLLRESSVLHGLKTPEEKVSAGIEHVSIDSVTIWICDWKWDLFFTHLNRLVRGHEVSECVCAETGGGGGGVDKRRLNAGD